MADKPDESQDGPRYKETWSLLRAMAAPPDAGAVVMLEPGTLVGGRYRIKGTLGKGGMGAVYLGRDEQLDRDIALKIQLRPDAADAKDRLAREAKALAQLSHPNVVTVYEVGQFEGFLFIAMEYVRGETLTAWLRRRQRKAPEIAALFAEAGRGLAAAHQVGLVHRDFKPDNVLVGRDGRARVADFGLALRPEDAAPQAEEQSQATDPGEGLSRIMGTPAYMAPEQIHGLGVDARTDQFAFCVALFEAVYGRRPFEAATIEELAEKISSGRLERSQPRTRVPGWLERVLDRGLSASPDDRFPSLSALLDALQAGPRRVQRAWLLAGALAGLLLAGMAGAVLWPGDPTRLCQGAEPKLATVWSESARQAMRASFDRTGLAFAPKTSAAVQVRLDGYGRAWTAEHTRACQATRVYAQQSEQALDLRMACLDRRLDEMGAVVELLGEADEALVGKALELVGSLTAPESCADAERLGRIIPPPDDPARAAAVEKAEDRALKAYVLLRAGRLAEAKEILEAGLPEDARSHVPLRAEWTKVRASLHRKAGEYKEAEAASREAVRLAAAAGDDRLLVRAMSDLAFVLATRRAPAEQTDSWIELAWAAASRLGKDLELEAELTGDEGYIRTRQGRYSEAEASARRAVEIREKQQDPIALARALNGLGMALFFNGKPELARNAQEKSLKHLQGVVGVEHPATLIALQTLGNACKQTGDYPAALAHTRLAAKTVERQYGPDNPLLLDLWTNMGVLLNEQGRIDEARAYCTRVLDQQRKRHGSDHHEVGFAMGNLAVQLAAEEHWDQAQTYAVGSRQVLAKALGEDHPIMINADSIIGTIERHRDKLDDSARALGLALERADRVLKPGHPGRINPRVELARTELARKNTHEAVRLARDALELSKAEHTPEQMKPDVWFAAAETLWAAGEQPEQALSYARKAEAGWEKMGMKQELQKARTWLQDKPPTKQTTPDPSLGE